MAKLKVTREKRGQHFYIVVQRKINLWFFKYWKTIHDSLETDSMTLDYYCEKYNCHSN